MYVCNEKYSKGFTLIELLVVVAIIGILATVVIRSLGAAKDSAKDVNAKQAARQIITQGNLYFDSHDSSFINFCSDPEFTTIKNYIGEVSGTDVTATADFRCYSNASAFAVAFKMKSHVNSADPAIWCVDSTNWSSNLSKINSTFDYSATGGTTGTCGAGTCQAVPNSATQCN